jgi:hypothetical protein
VWKPRFYIMYFGLAPLTRLPFSLSGMKQSLASKDRNDYLAGLEEACSSQVKRQGTEIRTTIRGSHNR